MKNQKELYIVTIQMLHIHPDGGAITSCQLDLEKEFTAQLFCRYINRHKVGSMHAVYHRVEVYVPGCSEEQRLALKLLEEFVDFELNYEGRG